MAKLPRSLRVDAVVLRHSDWGEADRLLIIFSQQGGKLRVIAKGARKPRSRKAGHLEPFTRVDLLLARGSEWWILTQAETIDAYLPLRDDLMRTAQAAYVVELLDRFNYEEGPNPSVYRLLVETLERLSASLDADLAVRFFEVRLLDLMGYRPQLFHCAGCGDEIKAVDQFFSAEQGGVLCPKCGVRYPGGMPVSVDALRYFRHFQRSSYEQAVKAQPEERVRREWEALMQHYLTYLLERGLNSTEFVQRVRGMNQAG